MKLQQYVLKNGKQRTVTWLESGRCKYGDKITLKDSEDPKALWTVSKVYEKVIEYTELKSKDCFGSIQGRSSQ